MRNVVLTVNNNAVSIIMRRGLAPIKITPIDGYKYKHHIIIKSIKQLSDDEFQIFGVSGSIGVNESFSSCVVDVEGDITDTFKIRLS